MTIARDSSESSRLRRRAVDILISVGLIFVASGGAISIRMTAGAKDYKFFVVETEVRY